MITTIKRNKIDPNKLHGIVIKESDKYLLIAREYDFIFDGFQIVRKVDVTAQYTSDSDAYVTDILKSEGIGIKVPSWVKGMDLTSWETILNTIKCKVIIIENERGDGKFYIGPIIRVSSKDVTLRYFDGAGKWGDLELINFRSITTCKFLDKYTTIHSKYLKAAQQVDAVDR